MRKFFGLFVVAAAVLMAGCPASQTPIQRASVDVGGDLVTSTGEQNFRDGDEIDQSRIVTGDKATVLAPNREPVDPEKGTTVLTPNREPVDPEEVVRKMKWAESRFIETAMRATVGKDDDVGNTKTNQHTPRESAGGDMIICGTKARRIGLMTIQTGDTAMYLAKDKAAVKCGDVRVKIFPNREPVATCREFVNGLGFVYETCPEVPREPVTLQRCRRVVSGTGQVFEVCPVPS